MLKEQLLSDQKFTITAKYVKSIVINGKCFVRIEKDQGLKMFVKSHTLISCRTEGTTLIIESYSKYNWFCFFNTNITESNKELSYSDTWIIDAMFIVSNIIVNNSGSLHIQEGYDKSLTCNKYGNGGYVSINNMYVNDFICSSHGGKIICNNSRCFHFTGLASGTGKIISPKIRNKANCNVKWLGTINCVLHDSCKIEKSVGYFGKLNMTYIRNFANFL